MVLLFCTGDGNNWKLLVIPLYITVTTFGMLKGMRMIEVITFSISTKSLRYNNAQNIFQARLVRISPYF